MTRDILITQSDISFDNMLKKERIKTVLELADNLRNDFKYD